MFLSSGRNGHGRTILFSYLSWISWDHRTKSPFREPSRFSRIFLVPTIEWTKLIIIQSFWRFSLIWRVSVFEECCVISVLQKLSKDIMDVGWILWGWYNFYFRRNSIIFLRLLVLWFSAAVVFCMSVWHSIVKRKDEYCWKVCFVGNNASSLFKFLQQEPRRLHFFVEFPLDAGWTDYRHESIVRAVITSWNGACVDGLSFIFANPAQNTLSVFFWRTETQPIAILQRGFEIAKGF